MTMHMIAGNQLVIYSIVRRVSRHTRMLVDYCLTLVDEVHRDNEITDRLFGVVCCRPSVSRYGTLADAREVTVVVVVVQAVVLTLVEAVLKRTSRQLTAQPKAAVGL